MDTTRTTLVKKWLRECIARMVNVQRCTFGGTSAAGDPVRDPDLVAYTWAGTVIQVHLIDEPIKTPKVRRIIESATGGGIGTLFILDGALLPKHGENTPANKWFLPFQALANERVYVYDVGAPSPTIHPVQFTPHRRDEVQAAFGTEVAVSHIRYLRHSVKYPALKGYWLIADFETEVTARNSPFRQGEPMKGTSNGAAASETTALQQCYTLLGLTRAATREEVRAAFRRLAFEVHPDVSDLPKDEAELRFKTLSEAYEFIKSRNNWA